MRQFATQAKGGGGGRPSSAPRPADPEITPGEYFRNLKVDPTPDIKKEDIYEPIPMAPDPNNPMHNRNPNVFTPPDTYPEHIIRIADAIVRLNMVEAAMLQKAIQMKMGITDQTLREYFTSYFGGAAPAGFAADPTGQAAAAAAAAAAPKQEKKPEKTTFDLKLTKIEDKQKLAIIKEMRNVVNLNIAETKALVEKLPSVVKKGVTKEEAEQIIAKFKEIGATIVME